MPPIRIQRKRIKGWKMPEGTVCVSRPSAFGNPFTLAGAMSGDTFSMSREDAIPFIVECFRSWAKGSDKWWMGPEAKAARQRLLDALPRLREAKYLACWCPLDQPCHADVLIEILKRSESPVAEAPSSK